MRGRILDTPQDSVKKLLGGVSLLFLAPLFCAFSVAIIPVIGTISLGAWALKKIEGALS
jgi:hypothetical protein